MLDDVRLYVDEEPPGTPFRAVPEAELPPEAFPPMPPKQQCAICRGWHYPINMASPKICVHCYRPPRRSFNEDAAYIEEICECSPREAERHARGHKEDR